MDGGATGKPVVWLHGRIKSPPFSDQARIGPRCLELRVPDGGVTWRIICRTDNDAVLVVEVFKKKRQGTPEEVMVNRQRRLRQYDSL